MPKIKVTVCNTFHGTNACAFVPGDQIHSHTVQLSPRQYKRLRKRLCCADCICFQSHTIALLRGAYYKLELRPA